MSDTKLQSETLTLKAIILSLALILAGVSALALSAKFEQDHSVIAASILRELGAFSLITFILGLWWEIIGRRSFSDELLQKIRMARTLEMAGITTVAMDFRDPEIDWSSMFSSSSRLDIWVAYGSTWRNSHLTEIAQFLQRDGSLLQIAVPDPDNALVVQTLSDRFSTERDDLVSEIRKTISEFQSLATRPGKIKIYLASSVPLFTFYRFNNSAVLAFYNHRKGRLPVPTIICSKDGTLYQYLVAEFAYLTSGAPLAAGTTI